MARIDLAAIVETLRDSGRVLITSHQSPDGDAIGSMLAMAGLARALGKQDVVCVLDSPVPRVYAWLPGAVEIARPEDVTGPFDLAVVLDVSQLGRTGDVEPLVKACPRIIVIDHHLEHSACRYPAFVDHTYAAVGCIIAELFDEADIDIDVDAAVCAYVAIATDTGSFRFSNSDARTHGIVARLLEAGIDVAEVSARVFDQVSRTKLALMGRYIASVRFSEDGRIAHGDVTRRDLVECGASDEETDGLINLARYVEGVDVAVLFREVDDTTTKVSLRAVAGVNSAEILRPVGGGGHAAAAGATLNLALDAARPEILGRIRAYLGESR